MNNDSDVLDLKILRMRKGFKQNFVAREIGMDSARLSRVENGWTRPTASQVRALATLYNVSEEEIEDLTCGVKIERCADRPNLAVRKVKKDVILEIIAHLGLTVYLENKPLVFEDALHLGSGGVDIKATLCRMLFSVLFEKQENETISEEESHYLGILEGAFSQYAPLEGERRSTHALTWKDITRSCKEWSTITGISYETILNRKKRGLPPDEIFKRDHLGREST